MKYNDPQNRAIIGGIRCCGKTTELIKMASRFNCLIVCASQQRAAFVRDMAKDMGLFIEPPQDIIAIISRPERIQGRDVTVLVDDVESVLEAVLRQSVKVMSTSANLEPMKCLREEDSQDATI